ncbi:uncharacterized protein Z518_01969 [Rhinocladiella mackenziei CBS 650.93]|uniref:FAD-binding domain-containing protein n=1 Tax=Rhinocladiella mackenziei CBS 650.93 TaxID=1442369 RepID=A0A0D2IVS3_9EURO|nr:uncharacterized protein Z518_01969 [Rhinocladiella mackenziei CBS 650.93]KIX07316.1 hypothetical protein Z518_01969 [Rhinocladiella mackenziei CBS 650.93]
MEQTPVAIVGAGPSGLALGLTLANHEINSIILEKEAGITEDPRGVFLAGDAVRILYSLGIADEEMAIIGHQVEDVNFHRTSFKQTPFYQLDIRRDGLKQTVPDGILQSQPKLEAALRDKVNQSKFCDLRENCEVVSRIEVDDGAIVEYTTDGTTKRVKCSFLVGADGKRGVVRKHFLEKQANIKQSTGLMQYEGCWVASNLKLSPPTPATHPDFPLWRFGYTPEDVYDLFWPKGWHFCCPPGKPTAAGRFGPHRDRFWRHEFREPDWNDSMDAEALLWEHITPMITHDRDGSRSFGQSVTFPRDCIEIVRCRPFTFTQRVVNKWHHKRIILIGDAAHVFPPFGGQGIACGVRDAHGLGWRLAVLIRQPNVKDSLRDEMLNAWASERRQGVDDSTRLTMMNGELCNEEPSWKFFTMRMMMGLMYYLPLGFQHPLERAERNGFRPTKNGCYLAEFNGGGKVAQVYLRSNTRGIILSDEALKRGPSAMTLLVIGNFDANESAEITRVLRDANLSESLLSEKSLVFIESTLSNHTAIQSPERFVVPAQSELVGHPTRPGYDADAYVSYLGWGTKYAIIRPDYIVFATARTLTQLQDCIRLLKERCDPPN